MGEFKTVVEGFRSDVKKVVEVMQHNFGQLHGQMNQMNQRMDRMEGRMGGMEGRMGGMEGRMGGIEGRMGGIEEQVGLLLEGQTEIKAELKNKVSYEEFSRLEKRVVRLERKSA